jgi:hypothetical protein
MEEEYVALLANHT